MPNRLIDQLRSRFPTSASDSGAWTNFKRELYDQFVEAIRQIDRAFAQEPHARAQKLRELRREHHLIVIADRIRRTNEPRDLSGEELKKAAAFVLDRMDHVAALGVESAGPRSHAEENMLTSARVNWHKLMKRAGSRAELRGGWNSAVQGPRGATALLRRIKNPNLGREERGEILRQHVNERLEQLVSLSGEVLARGDCELSAEDSCLIDEITELARRMRRPKS